MKILNIFVEIIMSSKYCEMALYYRNFIKNKMKAS